jgi:N,N'-diacetyllegionaminate synthase
MDPVEIGYSDHTTSVVTSYGAAVLGATMLEKHYTTKPGGELVPDHAMAFAPPRMQQYASNAQEGGRARGDGRLEPMPHELAARHGARRSCCYARDLPAGHPLGHDDITWLRPGPDRDGFGPGATDQLVGAVLQTDAREGTPIVATSLRWPDRG